MRRNDDGYFNDADLARVLHTAIEAPAGAPRSKGVASCLRAWQLELVQQSRDWEVCTLNEYRASLGLKRESGNPPFSSESDGYSPRDV